MEKKISELVHPEYKFDLMLSEDGSGRGAALVAAVAAKHRQAGISTSQ
jgi:hexokinase